MKIYFNASLAGKEKYPQEFKTIIKIVKDLGHEIYYKHVMERDYRKVNKLTKKEHQKDFQKVLKEIKESDAMIIEATYPSIGVGRTMTLAFELKKNVLVLYQSTPHGLLLGDPNRFLSVKRYNLKNIKKLEQAIANFLRKTKKRFLKKRFNLVLDKTHEDYLDWVAKKKNISKANVIRILIEKNMQEDGDSLNS